MKKVVRHKHKKMERNIGSILFILMLSQHSLGQSLDETIDDLCRDRFGPPETYSGIFPRGPGLVCVGGGFAGELIVSNLNIGSTFSPVDNLTSVAVNSNAAEISRDVISERIKESRGQSAEGDVSSGGVVSGEIADNLGVFWTGNTSDGERTYSLYENNYDPEKCWGRYNSNDRLCSGYSSYGADFSQDSMLLGVDYRFSNFLVGAALSAISAKVDSKINASSSETEIYQIVVFSTLELPYESYLDIQLGMSSGKIKYQREFSFTSKVGAMGPWDFPDEDILVANMAKATTDTQAFMTSIGVGKSIPFVGFTLVPKFSVNWSYANIENYREYPVDVPGYVFLPSFSGTYPERNMDELLDPLEEVVMSNFLLNVKEQSVNYLSSNAGMDLYYAYSAQFGVVSINGGLEWVHKFDSALELESSFLIQGYNGEVYSFVTKYPEVDNDYGRLSLGFVLTLPRGFSSYVLFERYLDNSEIDFKSYSLGLRIQI